MQYFKNTSQLPSSELMGRQVRVWIGFVVPIYTSIQKHITYQARREGGCDGWARTPPQTAEVRFFVKKINSKKKNNSVVLFVLF